MFVFARVHACVWLLSLFWDYRSIPEYLQSSGEDFMEDWQ